MNQSVLKKLKKWREQKADSENCELYRVFQNKTIEDISTLLPKNKEELLAIKGIREKKFQKYGKDVLAIVNECLGTPVAVDNNPEQEKTYTVSDYLDNVNSKLSEARAKIKGEVSSVSLKGHLYFSLKDKDDGSVLNCFMWANDYEMCGVEIKEGMELTVHGFPEIYKPSGRFNFRTSAVELVGEGALKKAYEELKKKLEGEGLFEEARKKPIPDYPHKIGLITSRDGAVINDFLNNIGRFGYKVTFVDSRVEGMMAVKDLINAVKYFQSKPVDVLVVIRGGGSLESLQAFNNEALIREIVKLPMPVLCGIGHDKDVPLLSYVADKAVSTPSIVAKEINKSWERAVDRLEYHETTIISKYEGVLRDNKYRLDNVSVQMKEFYQSIFKRFEQCEQSLKNLFYNISYTLKKDREQLNKMPKALAYYFKKLVAETSKAIDNFEKSLYQNNPERQLKLGYSIVTLNDKVVKSSSQVQKGDVLKIKVKDGKIHSKVEEIFSNLI
jgi:exodeoxyribonuclease VII large subunit